MKTELCELFEKYGSDKCPHFGFHTYSPVYHEHLKGYKETFEDVIEIGVGNKEQMGRYFGDGYRPGASLRAWRDFFVNAHVYGLDIRRDVLFSEDRIDCFYTDQASEVELSSAVEEIRRHKGDGDLLFDLILDDGSHNPEFVAKSFNCLSGYVKAGGIYVIEDVHWPPDNLRELLNEDGFEVVEIYEGAAQRNDKFIMFRKLRVESGIP
jgi:hypothetical protein